jgi:alpha-L-rhamnosidase
VPRNVDLVLPIEAPAPLLRRAFRVGKPVAQARLYLAAGGMPRMTINGTAVGSPLGAGFTAYDKRVLVYAYDVTALAPAGRERPGRRTGRGWYGVTDPNEWYFHAAPWHAEPALKAQLEITYADGTRETIATGGDWQAACGPDAGRFHLPRRALRCPAAAGGLGQGRLSCGQVARARSRAGPAGTLVAANAEPIAPVETIAPVSP